jgi:hypothetical protein
LRDFLGILPVPEVPESELVDFLAVRVRKLFDGVFVPPLQPGEKILILGFPHELFVLDADQNTLTGEIIPALN